MLQTKIKLDTEADTGKPCSLLVVPQSLSPVECDFLIQLWREQYPKHGDNELQRQRLMFQDSHLADSIFQRLYAGGRGPLCQFLTVTDEYGNKWELDGLNPRFRLVRYSAGEQFESHQDGFYQAAYNERSFVTLMFYLNTVEVCQGGATEFHDHGLRLQPRQGHCVLFEVDDLLHAGLPLQEGEKYILRTDVMYRCDYLRDCHIHQQLYELTHTDGATDWGRIFKLKKQLTHK